MLPAWNAGGDGAIAGAQTAVDVALAVRTTGAQWMWEIAKGAGVGIALWWTLPFWVRRR